METSSDVGVDEQIGQALTKNDLGKLTHLLTSGKDLTPNQVFMICHTHPSKLVPLAIKNYPQLIPHILTAVKPEELAHSEKCIRQFIKAGARVDIPIESMDGKTPFELFCLEKTLKGLVKDLVTQGISGPTAQTASSRIESVSPSPQRNTFEESPPLDEEMLEQFPETVSLKRQHTDESHVTSKRQRAVEEEQTTQEMAPLGDSVPQHIIDGLAAIILDKGMDSAEKQKWVDIFLQSAPIVNAKTRDGRSLLSLAVEAKEVELTKKLLAHGALIDEIDSSGVPPLVTALECSGPELATVLIDNGANPFIHIASGSLLHLICNNYERYGTDEENREVTEFLKYILNHCKHTDNEAEISNIPNRDGRSILLSACEFGDSELVNLILDRGVDPNHKDSNGTTPLDHVLSSNFPDYAKKRELVRLLLKNGATATSKSNLSILLEKTDENDPEFVELLLKYLAAPPLPKELENTPHFQELLKIFTCDSDVNFSDVNFWDSDNREETLFNFLSENGYGYNVTMLILLRISNDKELEKILYCNIKAIFKNFDNKCSTAPLDFSIVYGKLLKHLATINTPTSLALLKHCLEGTVDFLHSTDPEDEELQKILLNNIDGIAKKIIKNCLKERYIPYALFNPDPRLTYLPEELRKTNTPFSLALLKRLEGPGHSINLLATIADSEDEELQKIILDNIDGIAERIHKGASDPVKTWEFQGLLGRLAKINTPASLALLKRYLQKTEIPISYLLRLVKSKTPTSLSLLKRCLEKPRVSLDKTLEEAARHENWEAINLLIEAGATLTPWVLYRLLHSESEKGLQIFELAVTRNKNILNKQDESGRTVLHHCTQRYPFNLSIIEKLISLGADPSIPDDENKVPLSRLRYYEKMKRIPFHQGAILGDLSSKSNSLDTTKLNSIADKYNGLCEIICNRILMKDLLGKVTDENSLMTKLDLKKLNKEKVRDSHLLEVYPMYHRAMAVLFKKFPDNIFSYFDQQRLITTEQVSDEEIVRKVNRDVFARGLKNVKVGETLKFEVFTREGYLDLKGHSLLIKKTGDDEYIFFDPNEGQDSGLGIDQLCDAIDQQIEENRATEIVFLNGKSFLKRIQ